MFTVLRLAITIIIALVVFGWAVVAAAVQAPSAGVATDVELQGIPDVSFRKTTKPAKYRTPFIIPISPPDFGQHPGPPRMPTPRASVRRSAWTGQPRVLQPDVFTTPALALSEPNPWAFANASVDLLASPQTWASEIVATATTHSKVVSVAIPHVARLAKRVAEQNLNVTATMDQLRTKESWTLDELHAAMQQLRSHHAASKLLHMYWQLLEPRDQWRVGKLAPLDKSIELFRQRLFETRVALQINALVVTSLNRETADAQLQDLAAEVEELFVDMAPST